MVMNVKAAAAEVADEELSNQTEEMTKQAAKRGM